jgi:hypothetical protein
MEGQENNNQHNPTETQVDVEAPAVQPAAPAPEEGLTATLPSSELLEDPAHDVTPDHDLIEEERPKRVARPDSTTVVQEAPVFVKLDKPFDPAGITMAVPGAPEDEMQEALAAMPNTDPGATQDGRDWLTYAQAGYRNATPRQMLANVGDREGSHWEQTVTTERGKIGASRPPQNRDPNVKLRGEAAVLAVRQAIGLGGVIRIPLWHSGFHITLKTPSDAAILELERRLTEEKVLLGRMTNGMLFSNTSVFIASYLVEFALQHLFESTLKNKDDIASKIVSHDIQHLAWGLAVAIWPTGFQYVRSVLGETDAQNKVLRDRIAVAKLQWTDTTQLTKWQVNHMSNVMPSTMTDDSLKKYREEFLNQTPRRVKFSENLAITLKVPSLADHITNGQKWVNGIVVMTDRVFGMEQDLDDRNKYIFEQGMATYMRQYGHWIESIEANGMIIDDPETIDDTISALSANDEIREKFIEFAVKYIEDTTVSMIAVPTVAASEEQKYPRWPHLLPIDAMATFFTLLGQKVSQIRDRT